MVATEAGAARDDAGDDGRPDRLIALSDGIYAIAMTLLVLDVRVPDGLDQQGLRDALDDLWPKLSAYVLSFYILAAFWLDQRQVLRGVRRVDGLVLRLTLAGLGLIALLPFPTSLLAEYHPQDEAVVLYAVVIILIVLQHLALLLTIRHRGHAGPAADRRTTRLVVADMGVTVLVFGASLPIVLAVSPRAALYSWLALVPLKAAVGHRRHRAERGGS
ncbi:TMEM175 family protein [Kitasatospora sp. NPDC003701]